jgi:hypothetical protein
MHCGGSGCVLQKCTCLQIVPGDCGSVTLHCGSIHKAEKAEWLLLLCPGPVTAPVLGKRVGIVLSWDRASANPSNKRRFRSSATRAAPPAYKRLLLAQHRERRPRSVQAMSTLWALNVPYFLEGHLRQRTLCFGETRGRFDPSRRPRLSEAGYTLHRTPAAASQSVIHH